MIRTVIDASSVGPLVIPDEAETLDPAVLSALVDGACIVPPHWHFEVGNMALMAIRRQRASAASVTANLQDMSRFRITTDPLAADRSWGQTLILAQEHNLTVYDAAYLELAIRLALPLLSLDKHLLGAARRAGIEATPAP